MRWFAVLATSLLLHVWVLAEEAEGDKPFYLTLDTPPAPELTPAQALESFALAPGFRVELVASEPLIVDPVAITWDEDGRLYAAEMRSYMPDTFGTGQTEPTGAVVRLTDVDGDGRFDEREVLLDALVLPRAVAVVNEGLLIAEPPHLWLCPSATGSAADIDCDARVELGGYGDQPGSVEHAENGLLLGLDNWLYSAKSNRRLRINNGELEIERTLFRGQWGITQDDDGHLYYNTNSNLLSGDYYPADGVIEAGSTAAAGLDERILVNDEMFSIRVNPGVNRAYVPGVLREDGRLKRPTSASGMTTYRGTQFPAQYQRDVFVTEPAANVVAQLRLSTQGLRVKAEHVLYDDEQWGQREFFASTDERFRPVDLKVGPDGALYVVDMYRGIIQDHVFITEELRAQILARELDKPVGLGRIWRITHAAGPRTSPPRLSTTSVAELITLLAHDGAWQRATAQRLLLAELDPALDEQLAALIRQGAAPSAVHALWTLAGRDALRRSDVEAALESKDSRVARHALRAGGRLLEASALLALAEEPRDVAFSQQLIFSLAGHNSRADVRQALLARLDDADQYRRAAVQASLRGVEVASLDALLATGWSDELEGETGFVRALSRQAFTNTPKRMFEMLDWIAARPESEAWLQQAALTGLSEVKRNQGFERLQLEKAHPLFATDEDPLWRWVAEARAAFTWPGDDLGDDVKPLTPDQRAMMASGAEFYASSCANCHGPAGAGVSGLGPPLAGSEWVTGPSERLARIVLQGVSGPIEVLGEQWNSVMPGHVHYPNFSDEAAAGLLTYLHRSWGHAGRAIRPEFVAEIRARTAGRQTPWTAEELLQIPIHTHYSRYAGRYGFPSYEIAFSYDGNEHLHVHSVIMNGPLIEEKEDHFLYADRDARLEFVRSEDGSTSTGVRFGGGRVLPRLPSASTPSEELHNQLSAQERAEGWELLFDGQSLEQWRTRNHAADDLWQVVDGELTLTGGGGGTLFTKRAWGNFELMLEWKISEGGNSGVFILAQASDQRVSTKAPEIQVLDDARHPDNQVDTHRSGSLYDLIAAPPEAQIPAGEWNAVVIIHVDGHLQVWQNDVQTVDIQIGGERWNELVDGSKFATWQGFGTLTSGHIGLQDHGDVVAYRNLKLRPL